MHCGECGTEFSCTADARCSAFVRPVLKNAFGTMVYMRVHLPDRSDLVGGGFPAVFLLLVSLLSRGKREFWKFGQDARRIQNWWVRVGHEVSALPLRGSRGWGFDPDHGLAGQNREDLPPEHRRATVAARHGGHEQPDRSSGYGVVPGVQNAARRLVRQRRPAGGDRMAGCCERGLTRV